MMFRTIFPWSNALKLSLQKDKKKKQTLTPVNYRLKIKRGIQCTCKEWNDTDKNWTEEVGNDR